MTPTISDDALLKVNFAAACTLGAGGLLAPGQMHKRLFVQGCPEAPEVWRFMGLGMISACTGGMIIARSPDKQAKREFLRAAGVAWLVGGGLNAANMANGKQKKDGFGYAAAVGSAVLGAVLLAGGLRKQQ